MVCLAFRRVCEKTFISQNSVTVYNGLAIFVGRLRAASMAR